MLNPFVCSELNQLRTKMLEWQMAHKDFRANGPAATSHPTMGTVEPKSDTSVELKAPPSRAASRRDLFTAASSSSLSPPSEAVRSTLTTARSNAFPQLGVNRSASGLLSRPVKESTSSLLRVGSPQVTATALYVHVPRHLSVSSYCRQNRPSCCIPLTNPFGLSPVTRRPSCCNPHRAGTYVVIVHLHTTRTNGNSTVCAPDAV